MRLITSLLLASSLAFTGEPAPKVRTDMLVSAAWLAEHLNDPNLVILHIGTDKSAYDAGHIPGARFLAVRDFTRQDPPGVELPNPQALAMTFQVLGVNSRTKRVIIYASDWQPNAARAWFTLDYLGLGEKAAMLDGGMEEWMVEKRLLSTKAPDSLGPHMAPASPDLKKQADVLVYKQDVVSLLGNENAAAFLDARPLSRYRAGHIPGAKSIFWERFLVSPEHPVLKSPDELRQMVADAGASAGKKNVAYCEVGLQASFTYFVLKYLGYDAYNYDGSYAEWSKADEPVVRGDSPR